MKAIIIQDEDARALVDSLTLEKYQAGNRTNWECLDGRRTVEALAEEIHGKFRYVVVRWLQEQGASLVR